MKDRIRKIRKDAKLSMDKFGEKIGMTKSSVSRIENGENFPSTAACKMICREFRVNEEWLRTGEGAPYIEMTQHEQIMERLGQCQLDKQSSDEQKAEFARFKEKFASAILGMDDDGCQLIIDLLHELGYTKGAD